MTEPLLDPLRQMLAALDDPDPARRAAALGMLALARYAGAALRVAALLRDPDLRVRAEARAYFAALHGLDLRNVILAALLERAIAALGADRGYVALLDAAGQVTSTVAHDFSIDDSDATYLLSQKIAAQAARTRQTVLTSNAESDPRFGEQSIITTALRTIAAAPLLLDEQTVGVIYLDKRVKSGLISPADMAALQQMAADAAQELAALGLAGQVTDAPADAAPSNEPIYGNTAVNECHRSSVDKSEAEGD